MALHFVLHFSDITYMQLQSTKFLIFIFFYFLLFFFLHSFQIRFVAKIGNLEKNLDDQMERYLEENKDCDVEEAKKIRECFILFDKYIFIFKNN